MQEDNKPTPLHQDQEVAKIRLDIAKEYVLLVYRNLAMYWWWDGREGMSAAVDEDPNEANRYVLHQTEDSTEYDPLRYPLKPYRLGYVQIEVADEKARKPVDVKLVCSWSTVISFWQELEQILRREYPVIETSSITNSKEDTARNVELPKSPTTVDKWKVTWKTIKNMSHDGMSVASISKKMSSDPRHKNLHSDRGTLTKIIRAGKAGLLD